MMRVPFLVALTACGLWLASAAPGWSQDIGVDRAGDQRVSQPLMSTALPASTILGMEVRNLAGDDLGEVDNLIIDSKSGKIRYATLSVGGFLGIGEKLIAVPWSEFQLRRFSEEGEDNGELHLTADMTRDRIEKAPSVEKDNWSLFADENFTRRIDEFYTREPHVAEQPDGTRVE